MIAHSEAATTPIEQDEKVFEVNPKQYLRILERRKARNVLKKRYAEAAKVRQLTFSSYTFNQTLKSMKQTPYMHESRHKHAQKRPRSSTGRFLTKKEIEELKKKQADKGNGVFGVRQKRKRDDTESKVSSA